MLLGKSVIKQLTEEWQHAEVFQAVSTSRIDYAFYRVFWSMLFATYHSGIEHKMQNKHSEE